MGAFFTSLQVHATSPDQRAAVTGAIHAHMGNLGLVAAGPAEAATRTLLVGPAARRWISVYDSAMEAQDPAILEDLGGAVSAATDGVTVGVLVHDSDLLELRLFRAGKLEDKLTNWPGYFSGKPRPAPPRGRWREPRRSAWRDLLLEGHRIEELEEVWRGGAGPEATLAKLAAPVGWDVRYLTAGLSSLEPDLRTTCAELRWRAVDARTMGRRPPAFGHVGGPDKVTAATGDRAPVTVVAHNVAGPMHGIAIVMWGEAIERGLLAVDGVHVQVGSPAAPERVRATLAEQDGQLVAAIPTLAIPEGYESPAAALATGTPDEGLARWLSARIEVEVEGIAARRGTADLHVGLVPDENPEEGQTSWTTRVQIRGKGKE
jgi:hypothetical protein